MRSGGTACGTPCGGEQLSAIDVEGVDLLVLVRFVLTEFESVGERASAWRRRMAALSADGSGTGGTLVLGEGGDERAAFKEASVRKEHSRSTVPSQASSGESATRCLVTMSITSGGLMSSIYLANASCVAGRR